MDSKTFAIITDIHSNISSLEKAMTIEDERNNIDQILSMGDCFALGPDPEATLKKLKTILNCKNGKVIISGVGKSSIIARKAASTFSSTGTPSFFLDASNASHGDMGGFSNDVIILISFSGNSIEL